MSIVTENQLAGEDPAQITINGAGDLTNLGFCRELSVNVGTTASFSCSGTGTVLDIYRIGYYGGAGWHKVTTLTNTATTQPDPVAVADSNGATHCGNWSTTATWAVPSNAQSGLYCGVYRKLGGGNASYIPFIVRNDAEEVDIIYKTSDATWGAAYNYFGTMANPGSGSNVYGAGAGIGNITARAHYVSYLRPIITRGGVEQTYWLACEYPMIRFLERNGYKIKYVTCKDLDRDPSILLKGKIFLSSGHDEYWSMPMFTGVENWRVNNPSYNTHALFFAGNDVFWRIRYDTNRDGFWCYKDTMPGPGAHQAGVPLDPVHWTGTFKDTRQPGGGRGEWWLTGTDFRMNGINDFDVTLPANPYGGLPVWGNTALVDGTVTFTKAMGFEADEMRPTQPVANCKILAAYTRNIDNNRADDNGQTYNNNGNINWGIIAQRFGTRSVTVGFGTCQWSWLLDNNHDRNSGTAVSPAAQQFTINLLGDLGAQPGSIMTGMTARTPVSLNNYGTDPSGASTNVIKIWYNNSTWRDAQVIGVGQGGVLRPVEVRSIVATGATFGSGNYGDGNFGG